MSFATHFFHVELIASGKDQFLRFAFSQDDVFDVVQLHTQPKSADPISQVGIDPWSRPSRFARQWSTKHFGSDFFSCSTPASMTLGPVTTPWQSVHRGLSTDIPFFKLVNKASSGRLRHVHTLRPKNSRMRTVTTRVLVTPIIHLISVN